MGQCIAVKLEGLSSERWAVISNNSDTMFSPTFGEQLAALMFAGIYTQMDWRQPDRWTDNAQEVIAREITTFIDEKMPEGDRNRRYLPAEWMQAIFTAKYADDHESEEEARAEFSKGFRYDYDDLTEDCESQWKRGHVKALDMIIEWFHKWQAERVAATRSAASGAAPAANAMNQVKDLLPPGGKR